MSRGWRWWEGRRGEGLAGREGRRRRGCNGVCGGLWKFRPEFGAGGGYFVNNRVVGEGGEGVEVELEFGD